MNAWLFVFGSVFVGLMALWVWDARKLSRMEAAEYIDQFVNDPSTIGWSWDDFCHGTYNDKLIQEVAQECLRISDIYPPDREGIYCNSKGIVRLLELRDLLLADGADNPINIKE